MGAYVNSANVLADTGSIGQGFPHGFTVVLADAHLAIGEADVRLVMPALGALLILTVSVLVRRLTGSALASLCTAAILLVHPTARWFSLIPVSETLFAVLLAATFLLLAAARRHQDHWTAVAAGVAGASLLIVRANAVAMVVVVLLGLALSVVSDDRRTRAVQAWFNVTITLGLVVAYGYDVRYVRAYFVDSQLRVELPSGVFDLLDRFDLLRVSPSLAVVAVVVTAAVGGLSVAWPERRRPDPASRRWLAPSVYGAIFVVTAVATMMLGSASTTDALVRWHTVFLVLAVLGASVLVGGARRADDLVVVAMALTVGASGIVLYAVRLDEPMSHAYHLYWDRYLYGDAFVVASMLAGIGVAAVVTVLARLAGRDRLVALAVGCVVVVAAVIGAVPMLDETALVTRHELFGDAYGALAAVADEVPTDRSAPIVFTGAPRPPDGWFFPNTFRAYGLPLRHTFERPMLNIPVDPFAPDPTVSVARARFLIAAFGTDHGFLLRVHGADQQLPGVGGRGDAGPHRPPTGLDPAPAARPPRGAVPVGRHGARALPGRRGLRPVRGDGQRLLPPVEHRSPPVVARDEGLADRTQGVGQARTVGQGVDRDVVGVDAVEGQAAPAPPDLTGQDRGIGVDEHRASQPPGLDQRQGEALVR